MAILMFVLATHISGASRPASNSLRQRVARMISAVGLAGTKREVWIMPRGDGWATGEMVLAAIGATRRR